MYYNTVYKNANFDFIVAARDSSVGRAVDCRILPINGITHFNPSVTGSIPVCEMLKYLFVRRNLR